MHANQTPGVIMDYDAARERYRVAVRSSVRPADATEQGSVLINVRRENFVLVAPASMEEWLLASLEMVHDAQAKELGEWAGAAVRHRSGLCTFFCWHEGVAGDMVATREA